MTEISYIVNATTQEIIERPMTKAELDAEKAEREAREAAEAFIIAEEQAKAIAKADLLTKLGITADEAKLLLS